MPYLFRKCSCFNSKLFQIFCLICFHPFKQQERSKLLINIRWADLQMWFNLIRVMQVFFIFKWIDKIFDFLIFLLFLLYIEVYNCLECPYLSVDVDGLLCCMQKWGAYVCTSATTTEGELDCIQGPIATATEWHFGGLGSKSLCK